MRSHVDEASVVDLTRRLVAIDTRNPPGNEADAIGLCRDALAPFGATFQVVEPAPGRTSLVARIGEGLIGDSQAGDGSRPALIVNGHLDVVPLDPSDWHHDPFGGDLDAGRLYGRGTADMKGGIAAAIEALHVLRRAGREPACDLVFHLVADEERGGALGTEVIVRDGLAHAAACIVPEPTSLGVCVAERGLMVVDLVVHGRPAHGSNPRDGVSAIEKAAEVVLALHAADFGGPTHPLLGRPTANVGVIDGGSGHNTVAERCRLVIDRRLLPSDTKEAVLAGIRARIEAVGDPELHYELLEPTVWGEASELDAGHWLVGQMGDAVAAATGDRPGVIGLSFTTDARFVRNTAGVPAVVCGPGDLDQAHVADEWVRVDRLVDAAAAYAGLFASFAVPG